VVDEHPHGHGGIRPVRPTCDTTDPRGVGDGGGEPVGGGEADGYAEEPRSLRRREGGERRG
jgi:hypothetical protein